MTHAPEFSLHQWVAAVSLRTRLVAFVLAPLLTVVAVTGWLGLSTLERETERRMQEDIELIARAIRLPLSHALENGQSRRMQQALDSAFRFGRVFGAYVYDSEGERIAAVGPRRQAVRQPEAAEIASEGDRQGVYDRRGNTDVFSYFVPLTGTGGQIIGLLQINRRGSDFADYMASLRLDAALALLVLTVMVTGLVLFGHHSAVGKHLRRLEGSMAHIGAGNRDHRVALRGPREVLALSRGMNEMLDNMERSEHELAARRAEQAALESRLRHSEKMAAIGQLAAGVAHELGTPLNVVDGYAQRGLREAGLSDPATERLNRIRAEVRRMEAIVRQLMEFSRRERLNLRSISADRLARTAVARIQGAGELRGRIELIASDPIPCFFVDRSRIEQALLNLLRNATQAAPGARARIGWFVAGEEAGFTVEDAGPGVPDALRDRIFEPFFTTKPVGQGTGLGLSVTHGIIEEHGGRVEVTRSPLGGACFRITLPRHSPQEDHP